MTVRLSGAEFKRFYADPAVWGANTYQDDALIRVDGVNALDAEINLSEVADAALVEIETGEVVNGLPGVPEDLVDAVDWWRARQTTVQYLVPVPQEQVEAFQAALRVLGLHSTTTPLT